MRQLLDYIIALSEKYTLHVAIGRLTNIRNRARRGNYRGCRYRRMIHSWAFSRITEALRHGLRQLGWSVKGRNARFRVVPESWTSLMCWKCGAKGTRPTQSYFKCSSCGHKTNADRNGAINIAGRLVTLTKSLHSVRGLGKWADSVTAGERSRSKAREDNRSRGKSLLSIKGSKSAPGESAAVHFVQSDLLSYCEVSEESDDDHAVERTMERLAVDGSDDPSERQEKEARSAGGIPSL